MARAPGLSARAKLTLSYVGLVVVAGLAIIAVVWVFLLRYVPDSAITVGGNGAPEPGRFIPGRSDLWDAFAPKAGLMLLALLVLGLVGGWLLAGRMLAPLHRIADATRKAGAGSLSHRIELPGRDDELRELADAFDGMLERLEAHVAEQQRFAANASHELRTPLAITQTLLEVARTDPSRLTPALVDTLYDINARAIALTEAMLVLSRAEREPFAHEILDISLIAEEAAEQLLPLAEKNAVALDVSGEVALTVGSPSLLQQLMSNLIHNAVVHNLAEGGSVWVATAQRADTVILTVQNTGDVLDPTTVETLAEPFQRGTQRVHSDQAGVGLGLAIVARIAQVHGGSLRLAPRAGGGLQASVILPAAGYPQAGDDAQRGSTLAR
ncbi:HAMP domain-containing protein [Epidermidibacterium keratini]|uniref:histidine kinase n=1 Tax=Epidermidibacterium keratini TaxID=1891644 RepID=A0A7L4YRN6_9ACTN|nr:HAMP domain-containing sensor histidine kinase [Epidermidibacterium keratini]QHC01623.1 HAMP domain-containing protein [Epidermidibacterium keratini]